MAAGRTVLCLVVLFVCTLLLHSGDVDALQCYQCATTNAPSSVLQLLPVPVLLTASCGHPSTPGVPTCTAGTGQYCLTLTGDNAVTRFCGQPSQYGLTMGCQAGNLVGISGTGCACNTDLCNSTPPTTLATFTFISVCALSTLVYVSLF